MQDFDLLIAYGIGVKRNWWLYCDECEEFEHVVLHHIANSARFFVVAATTLQAQILRDGDLYMVHIPSIPYGFKDAICQAEDQDILDRLFAEVMVDTEYLLLAEDLADLTVQFSRGSKVMAEWLFYNYTCPTFAVAIQSCRAQILNDLRILTGGC